MIAFSANLGFLWQELTLPDAIKAAAEAGFDAVECHWPSDTDPQLIVDALQQTGLSMLGINTQRGDVAAGDNGVAAITGREKEAQAYIDEAIRYADTIGCRNVHVMAGFTDKGSSSQSTLVSNLNYACTQARAKGITILIEPLNHYDAPGYHYSTLDEALTTLSAVGEDNLKIMFDCYHLQITQGDLYRRLKNHLPLIGHIQIAAVPDRSEPCFGEVNYKNLLTSVVEMGWTTPIGAEYKPRETTSAGIAWLDDYKLSKAN